MISDDERRMLNKRKNNFNIPDERTAELEEIVKKQVEPEIAEEEKQYLECLKISYKDGVVSDDERRLLDEMKTQSGISDDRAAELEESVKLQTKSVKQESKNNLATKSDAKACETEKKTIKRNLKSYINESIKNVFEQSIRNYSKAGELLLKSITEGGFRKHNVIREFTIACAKKLEDNSCFYTYDKIPDKKKKKASETFLKKINRNNEPIYLFFDNTFWGGAKDGFAISNKRISWNYQNVTSSRELSWKGFSSARLKGTSILFQYKDLADINLHMANKKDRWIVLNIIKILNKISSL